MKVLAVCFVLALGAVVVMALTDEQKAKLKKHHEECLAESGVNPDLITKARQGNFEDDAKLKEHFFCLSKKIGFQNDKGELQLDVIKTKLNSVIQDEKKTDDIIAKCGVQKDSPQQTAYEVLKCYHDSTHASLV